MSESIEYIGGDIEFWIGKDDFLLWRYRVHMEANEFIDKDKATEKKEYRSDISTVRFLSFNEPIEIEPPPAELIRKNNAYYLLLVSRFGS